MGLPPTLPLPMGRLVIYEFSLEEGDLDFCKFYASAADMKYRSDHRQFYDLATT
jgi:hypothetical protein